MPREESRNFSAFSAVTSRLTALAFALGSLEHFVGLVLLGVGIEMYAGYPAWRHAVFALVDASIAWVAWRRPRWLFFPLLAFLVEQTITNGRGAWRAWRLTGQIRWVVVMVIVLVLAATIAAGVTRGRNP